SVKPKLSDAKVATGYYYLTTALSGSKRAITVKDASYFGGAKTEIQNYGGHGSQKWYIKSIGSGYYLLRCARSDNYLDVRGTSKKKAIIQQTYLSSASKATNSQKFKIKQATVNGKVYYYFIPKTSSKYMIDVHGSKNKNGADLILWKANSASKAVRFNLTATTWSNSSTRSGSDTFVQVDLSLQKLVLFVNGAKKLESNVITGRPSKPTPTGNFHVILIAKNYTMNGPASDPYHSFCKYVAKFKDNGYYMHDASWQNWSKRAKTGASYRKTHGSHGCVNMPTSAAKKLYDTLKAVKTMKTPVIITK
ncbi:MAG: L,D-transpeptidase family protein, partial [Coriobacteriales bacterium]|nr:L,D-transpeptidase family protein [Coriobacteriales bacterium]